ncbi:hypothetical protein GS506_02825 [Rhodococcus hoagii]|nr:hypothetical protein [Prescottella equi]
MTDTFLPRGPLHKWWTSGQVHRRRTLLTHAARRGHQPYAPPFSCQPLACRVKIEGHQSVHIPSRSPPATDLR